MISSLYLESTASRPRLRVGVLIDGPAVPRFVATILTDLARSNFAAVEVAMVLRSAPSNGRPSAFLHDLYASLDRAIAGPEDPLAPVAPDGLLDGVERIEAQVGPEGRPWLSPEAIDEIRRRDLDVILRFSSERPRGDVLRAARHGVWSYHFGADETPRDGTPFLQQVVDRMPTRDVLLEVVQDEPGAGLVLCHSSFGSQGNLLLGHFRRVAVWETTHFIVWKLHDLHQFGWEHLVQQAIPRTTTSRPGIASPPSTTEMVRFLAPRLAEAVVNRVRGERLHHGVHMRWRIGLRRGHTRFGSTRSATGLDGFRWIEAPADHYYADPFLLEREGTTFVAFEDYDYARRYASIRAAEVHADCSIGPSFPCLDLGYHLSFPNIFEHDGELFMIPESLSDGTVTLYRARSFPGEWVREKVLFRGNATDTTLWREGTRFFFFTTLHERDDRGMKTLLFSADSLTGDWRLHPANPVSSDARHARGAGALFRHEGRLFRPSQDCGANYGHGLNLEEVVKLTGDAYEERTWCSVQADALPFEAIGLHTFNGCGDYEAIDASVSFGPRVDVARWMRSVRFGE